jgi:5-formyltetrahydrofolate cyclo-ligase
MPETPDDLRRRNRKRRSELDRNSLQLAAVNLHDKLCKLDEYRRSQHIAVYWAVNGEIGLGPVIEAAGQKNKKIYLPVLGQDSLRFAPYDKNRAMRFSSFKIPEPDVPDEAMLAPDALDLVLVPLTVFDPECNRVGMGGGYYDRSFAFRQSAQLTTPVLIGVAHDFQRVDQLQPASWDVRLDAVVTDQRIYRP